MTAKSNRPNRAFSNITSVCWPLVLGHVLIDRLIVGYVFGSTVAAALHARCPLNALSRPSDPSAHGGFPPALPLYACHVAYVIKKKKSVRCIARFLYTVLYTDCHPASGLGRMGGGEMGDSSETRVFLGTETRWRGELCFLLFSP